MATLPFSAMLSLGELYCKPTDINAAALQAGLAVMPKRARVQFCHDEEKEKIP